MIMMSYKFRLTTKKFKNLFRSWKTLMFSTSQMKSSQFSRKPSSKLKIARIIMK